MPDDEATRNWAYVEFIGDAMREHLSSRCSRYREESVAMIVFYACPFPACIGLSHLRPEPIGKEHCGSSHSGLRFRRGRNTKPRHGSDRAWWRCCFRCGGRWRGCHFRWRRERGGLLQPERRAREGLELGLVRGSGHLTRPTRRAMIRCRTRSCWRSCRRPWQSCRSGWRRERRSGCPRTN